MSIEWAHSAHGIVKEPQPYTGKILPLLESDAIFFQKRFGIPAPIAHSFIRVDPDSNRYVLPILSPHERVRGHVLRYAWNGAPRHTDEFYPKAQTFKADDSPLQSFYAACWGDGGALVLVEDQISAITLAASGYSSVAILGKPTGKIGSYSGHDRVSEIARVAGLREVIVALDSDATADAFNFVRVWGAAFHKCRVAILTDDIKDTRPESFYEVLGA